MMIEPLPPESIRLRRLVIDALWPAGDDRAHYGDAETFAGVCQICDKTVVVRFAGRAPRATLDCRGGCRETDVAARIGLRYVS
jgi:hypothetical protein